VAIYNSRLRHCLKKTKTIWLSKRLYDLRVFTRFNDRSTRVKGPLVSTLLAMLVIKDLMSSWVGQLFWHGASAHLRHLRSAKHSTLNNSAVL